jgi:2-deoxy-D-gluconate 3-dehydrogenase
MKNLFSLEGKKVLLTGGAAGLGRSIIQGMHDAGAEVAIIDISDSVFQAAKEIQGDGPNAYGIKADLGNKESLEKGFNEAIEKLGGYLDILVNNAGVQRRCPAIDFSQEDWDFVIKLNLTQVFQMSQLAGKIMIKRGYGKIINIASMNTFITVKNISAYAASKGAIGQYTKSLANEWGGFGINVNALAPGFIQTQMTASVDNTPDRLKLLDRIPAGRWGKPDDLVGTAIYLASSASDYVNGAIIPIDGGFLAN